MKSQLNASNWNKGARHQLEQYRGNKYNRHFAYCIGIIVILAIICFRRRQTLSKPAEISEPIKMHKPRGDAVENAMIMTDLQEMWLKISWNSAWRQLATTNQRVAGGNKCCLFHRPEKGTYHTHGYRKDFATKVEWNSGSKSGHRWSGTHFTNYQGVRGKAKDKIQALRHVTLHVLW